MLNELREIVRKNKAGIRRLTVEYPDDLAPEDVERVRHLRRALGLCAYCGTHPSRQFCWFDPKRRDKDALPLASKTAAQMRRAASKALYAASPKGRAAAAKYAASEKGRARSASYNRSDLGARRAIAYNRTTKGRARSERFERTAHRRDYKALSYFGSPYKDPEVTAALAVNRNKPLITQGLQFKTISVRCTCWKCRGRRLSNANSSRRIPIDRVLSATAPLRALLGRPGLPSHWRMPCRWGEARQSNLRLLGGTTRSLPDRSGDWTARSATPRTSHSSSTSGRISWRAASTTVRQPDALLLHPLARSTVVVCMAQPGSRHS